MLSSEPRRPAEHEEIHAADHSERHEHLIHARDLPTSLCVGYTRGQMVRRATAMRDPGLSAVEVAVTALGTFRLVRLITTDDFPPIELARTRIIEWAGKDSSLASLIGCSWCSGAWISAAVVALALRYPAARKALLVPAISGAVGLLATADAAMGRSG